MGSYKHRIGDPLDAPLFGGIHQGWPVLHWDGASVLHHRGMAFPLQSEISGQFRSGWPQGDDVVNSAHTELIQSVLVEVNTHSKNDFDTTGVMKTRGERLRWARQQAGYRSALAVSKELGIPYSTYNTHERAGEPGGRDFTPEQAESYARKFRVAHAWLLTGKGDPKAGGDQVPPQLRPVDMSVTQYVVAGSVAAGTFREVAEFFDEEPPKISAPVDMKYPDARHMAFIIEGDSMNKAKPPMFEGGYVLCVDYEDLENRVPLRDGMKVVIERTKDGGQLREWSVKEVELYEDRVEFHPRSDNPKHRAIVVPRDFQPDDGTEVKILGLVRSVHYPAD
ncbi:helix-turn-helix transcriptional regulator [Microvirga sp. Mcv34]|uniref:LexA family transcriptional regulator n=1 Tax=Microvirga sp. Mcv34 TaxID=2926016 RepID=UPI0021C61415|nr:XRE family transcriptional regulator [Microvirga sp. Mcv34]